MTTHEHPIPASTRPRQGVEAPPPPGWLFPALIGVPVVGALLVFGLLSPSLLLYAGLFGGMMLLCMGGHGHAGHGDGGHGSHGDGANRAGDLSRRSSGAQPAGSGSSMGPDGRAADDSTTSEISRHDQPSSNSCH